MAAGSLDPRVHVFVILLAIEQGVDELDTFEVAPLDQDCAYPEPLKGDGDPLDVMQAAWPGVDEGRNLIPVRGEQGGHRKEKDAHRIDRILREKRRSRRGDHDRIEDDDRRMPLLEFRR